MLFKLFMSCCLIIFSGISHEAFGQDTAAAKSTAEKILISSSTGDSIVPRILTANDLSIATGKPSLVKMSNGTTNVPVWSLSGGTVGQSVSGTIPGFPEGYSGVKVEISITTEDKQTSSQYEDVFRAHLSQLVKGESNKIKTVTGNPVRTALPNGPFKTHSIILETFFKIEPNIPLTIRIQREPGDPADTFIRPIGLISVKITPQNPLAKPVVVQDIHGYNSWPMTQAIGNKIVCTYSRGSAHSIGEDARAVYTRTSSDGGKTWTAETVIANTPNGGEVTIGKGLDANGAMLLWIRRIGKDWNHDLYRTTDGIKFTPVVTPKFEIIPIQITDVFSVPKVGLMALWFAGDYGNNGPCHSWGTLVSSDNGSTWKQIIIESKLNKADWPTEPSAVYLGNGKILALARSEMGSNTTERSQFQLISFDYGKTWKRSKTNIGDVLASSPSLILDPDTGLLSNYYYHRGRGVLRRRVVEPDKIFENPLNWPVSEAVSLGSDISFDAGNSNATVIGKTHYVSFYSGKAPDTAVLVTGVPAPAKK